MSTAEMSVATYLNEISRRLISASAVMRAAVICAEAGAEREALRIALDVDETLHDAQTLHAAMLLLGRSQRQSRLDDDDD